jgi:hypothetical protein
MPDPPALVDLMPVLGLEGESWAAWRVVAKALDGQGATFTRAEQALFEACTGRTRVPTEPPAEVFGIIGRRSGKSRFAGAVAARAAGLIRYPLAPGERAVVGLAAADREQARVMLGYTLAPFEASADWRGLVRRPSPWARLADLVTRRTRWGFDLTTGATVEVRTAAFGSIRGRTYAAVVADELAYWQREEGSNPASEVLGAVRPGLVTLGGPLIGISSPYAKAGPLWEAWTRYYGKDDARVLVWKAPSRVMNPTIPERVVLDALERDEASARSEWLAEFRSDLESFLSSEQLARVVVPGRGELPPRVGEEGDYLAFCDPATGAGQDSMTLAIVHLEAEGPDAPPVVVVDALREHKPPFNPREVTREYAALCRAYACDVVYGDRHGMGWIDQAFASHHLTYQVAESSKSELYAALLPLITTGSLELPDHPRLVQQLQGLERRPTGTGRDAIDHRSRGHEDLANAVAGAAVLAHREASVPEPRLIPLGW